MGAPDTSVHHDPPPPHILTLVMTGVHMPVDQTAGESTLQDGLIFASSDRTSSSLTTSLPAMAHFTLPW